MAKLFYLVDATQEMGLQTNYYREAAGPLDTKALYSKQFGVEALAVRNEYVRVEQVGKKIRYRRGVKLKDGMETAKEVLTGHRVALNRLIDLFRPLDTEQCEIVATLYACWNDMLLDGRDVTDESIIKEFLWAWHERKRRFSRSRLLKALEWMRSHRLMPAGRGSHTRTKPRPSG